MTHWSVTLPVIDTLLGAPMYSNLQTIDLFFQTGALKVGSQRRQVIPPCRRVAADAVTVRADGVEGGPGVVCVKLPAAPKGVTVNAERLVEGAGYDYADGVARVRFVNRADPVEVVIRR